MLSPASVDKMVSTSRTDVGGLGTSEGTMGSRAVSGLIIITVRTLAMVVVSALARESTSLLGASSEKDTQTATELQGRRVPTTLSVHVPQDLLPGWTGFRKKTFSC